MILNLQWVWFIFFQFFSWIQLTFSLAFNLRWEWDNIWVASHWYFLCQKWQWLQYRWAVGSRLALHKICENMGFHAVLVLTAPITEYKTWQMFCVKCWFVTNLRKTLICSFYRTVLSGIWEIFYEFFIFCNLFDKPSGK